MDKLRGGVNVMNIGVIGHGNRIGLSGEYLNEKEIKVAFDLLSANFDSVVKGILTLEKITKNFGSELRGLIRCKPNNWLKMHGLPMRRRIRKRKKSQW